jgi:hypothetical protein
LRHYWISLAGPAVNAALAQIRFAVVGAQRGAAGEDYRASWCGANDKPSGARKPEQRHYINVALGGSNLPAKQIIFRDEVRTKLLSGINTLAQENNAAAAQAALLHRARCNSAARFGQYSLDMEARAA